jgi:Na+/H+-translocating membrane pyrophosphatase
LVQKSTVESAIATEAVVARDSIGKERSTLDSVGYVLSASGLVLMTSAWNYDSFAIGAIWDDFEGIAGTEPAVERTADESRKSEELRREVDDEMSTVKGMSGLGVVLVGLGLVLVFLPEESSKTAALRFWARDVEDRNFGLRFESTW